MKNAQHGKSMTWKMHDMENAHHEKGRKCTYWKMTEKSQPENDRMENAHP